MYILDHLINAIGSHKLSCLCLLDLSAAVDTFDHNILITRLSSWFGVHVSVLNWLKSYLASCSFHVKCDKDFSSEHISSCGVHQGSVLGPLLFVMLPRSALSSPHFLLTITFTQMIITFFSFHPRNFDSSIAHLQTALKHISSWMSANLLTLNSSETEFLIIGHKQQFSKILQSIPLILHATLVLSLMKILLFLIRSHHFLSPAILIFVSSAVSVLTLILKHPVPTIAAYIVHSKFDYCNSLYFNLPKSQINRLQQIQNCLARKSSHITPILRSLHWLKINDRSEYKLLSFTYKVLTTSQPDYLPNLITVQSTGRTRSSSFVTLARPSISSSLQITNRSFTYASPYLWNQLPSSFRQPHSVHCPPGSPHPAHIT